MESKEEYFLKMSQNRMLRRTMAKQLGMRWQDNKEKFVPYRLPIDLGIKEFKKRLKESELSTSQKNKAVLKYKVKAYSVLANIIKPKEA